MNIPLKRPPRTAQKAGDVYTFNTERKVSDPPVVGCQTRGKNEAHPRRGFLCRVGQARVLLLDVLASPQEAWRPSAKIPSAL